MLSTVNASKIKKRKSIYAKDAKQKKIVRKKKVIRKRNRNILKY